MMLSDIVVPVIVAGLTGAITGGIAVYGTVKALSVHIAYLRDHLTRLEQSVIRAHVRIDNIDRRAIDRNTQTPNPYMEEIEINGLP